MKQPFAEMLRDGGKSNSLGKADEVIAIVLQDQSLLDELYSCIFDADAWVRMRAIDSIEKICRDHPTWIEPYIDKFLKKLSSSTQPSIQWHLAQIYKKVTLSQPQKRHAIEWMKDLLSSKEIDWIVAANAMDTLVFFAHEGSVSESKITSLLKVQQQHKSKAVVKRANKLLNEFNGAS